MLKSLVLIFVTILYGCGSLKVVSFNDPTEFGREISEIEDLSKRHETTVVVDCPKEDCLYKNVQNIKIQSDSIKFSVRTRFVSRHLKSADIRYSQADTQTVLALSSVKTIKINRRLKGAATSFLVGSAFFMSGAFIAGANYQNYEDWNSSQGSQVAKIALIVTGPFTFIGGAIIGSESRYENSLHYSEQSEEEKIRRRFSPRN